MSEQISLRINTTQRRKNHNLARGTQFPKTFGISRQTFRNLEEWMNDNDASIDKARAGMDAIVRLCILVVKAEVQKRSYGPLAPNQRSNPALAYRIPVQRITGHYFAGWHVRRTSRGWMIYNDELEAYLVETGLYQRVRRPILKMSVVSMLRFIQSTKTADRFVDWVFQPRRDPRGRFQSFNTRVMPTVSTMAGPSGKLPG